MKRILICIVCSLLYITSFAQIARQGDKYTDVPLFEGKVTFIKEVPAKANLSAEGNYTIMKDWAGVNFGKDPFVSSIRYGYQKRDFIAKSRIELLLPPDSNGVREKMVMRYRVNGFLFKDKCVLEITDISYLYENSGKNSLLSRIIRAEDFITEDAIKVNDSFQELKTNTRKSTLYFLNELVADFEDKFKEEQKTE